MTSESGRERRIRSTIYTIIVLIAAAYVLQGLFIHFRLGTMEAKHVDLRSESEICDQLNCSKTWTFEPHHRFLLLGHLMRTHLVFHDETNEQVLPVSRVRGTVADSWASLRIYSVVPSQTYRLVATKPRAVQMGYFVGVLPRTTDHEAVLSVPDISPTISVITSLAGIGILGLLLFAAFQAPTSGLGATERRDRLLSVSASSLACVVTVSLAAGIVDSLIPDGEIRGRILRTALLMSATIVPLSHLTRRYTGSQLASIMISCMLITFIVNYNWQHLRAGMFYVATYSCVVIMLSTYLFRIGYQLAGSIAMLGLIDSARMLGIYAIQDSPPIYVFYPIIVATFGLVVSDLGAISVLSLAAKAYHRLTRDIALSDISSTIQETYPHGQDDLSEAVKNTLPKISNLTGAGRVSILINLPFARPITHGFDHSTESFITHDDGKIPGAVTIRAFVYGDEAWFEKYSSFSKRLNLPHAAGLSNAEYICIAPIRVNQTNMGVMMLTCFDDNFIEKRSLSEDIDDEKDTAKMIVETLSARFSEVALQQMKETSSQSTDLLARLRESIPKSSSTIAFLKSFCEAAHSVTGLRTMIHQRVEESGVAITQHGFGGDVWQLFLDTPFNLSRDRGTLGSTVIAFLESRSSYVKDWVEIRERLHPKTVAMLEKMNARSFLAVPLKAGMTDYVVTMVSDRSDLPKDPSLMRVIESTEAIFDASVTVLNQRTSVLALGKIANRLIGDDEVRNQIIEAAKEENLQTTIGTPRSSFLLLFDLAGSSSLPADTEEKAKSYGIFYDEVNEVSQKILGGMVRKTIGDAVIVTWDGSSTRLEDHQDLLHGLGQVVNRANTVAKEVGCRGVRAVLHYGEYFFGLIGTSSFGQIDVIGSGIDEVCRMESGMKARNMDGKRLMIVISSSASERLNRLSSTDFIQAGYQLGSTQKQFSDDMDWALVSEQEDTSEPNSMSSKAS